MSERTKPYVANARVGIFETPGFAPFGLDYVIKVGGSILKDLGAARRLGEALSILGRSTRILLFPGGGPTDKLIESIARQLSLHSAVINPACLRAMDQTGIIVSTMADNFEAVTDLRSVRRVLEAGNTPILLPSELILGLDVFIRHDLITSDTLGAYFAYLTGTPRYVILTDVDGIFHKLPVTPQQVRPVVKITASELDHFGATCVDACLAPFARATGLHVFVMNGLHPERIEGLLTPCARVNGTEIVPE